LVSLKLPLRVVDTVLMTKVNFEETFEIYLFTDNEVENNFSKLNEFLSFLKFNKVNLPYKFSYVGRGDSLIPEMTLNENILMDFSPDSLTEARELQFQEFLKQRPNQHLEKLYQKLAFPHELPDHSDAQMKRIAILIKSLIFEGQFIFLEEPEKDLDHECTELFICALKDHISRSKQNVFIYSSQLDLWTPHVHQHVKREKDFSFSTEKVSRSWMWKKERELFYRAMTKESPKSELLFNIPKKNSGKKSAA
jgi:hypothetical protein